jgi:hypothetical protein
MVRALGAVAASSRWRARKTRITVAEGSPPANRASASLLRSGHAYDPGRLVTAAGRAMRARCAARARRRPGPKQPAASHAPPTLATKSRPARRAMNSADRCAAHSHTQTPKPSSTFLRSPSPGPMQIRHGGRFPSPRALYRVRAMTGIVAEFM